MVYIISLCDQQRNTLHTYHTTVVPVAGDIIVYKKHKQEVLVQVLRRKFYADPECADRVVVLVKQINN